MKLTIKGLHTVKSKGNIYYYAWRGGPRIDGKPGSPEFIKNYNEAIASFTSIPKSIFQYIINEYQKSHDFKTLSIRTQKDYKIVIKEIEEVFSKVSLKAIDNSKIRKIFMDWRDKRAEVSPRRADYNTMVLSLILNWAKNRFIIENNFAANIPKVYKINRKESTWSKVS